MRARLVVRGTVQGVGFRPFVHRAARARRLTGWVRNTRDAVCIEIQGSEAGVRSFADALAHDSALPAVVRSIERTELEERDEVSFRILESDSDGSGGPVVPPDLATCAACLADSRAAGGRRFRYPFTNCTACGPRWSICTAFPYDRRETSMRGFTMCRECAREYEDVDDRRYHAQPNACPRCGPSLTLLATNGQALATKREALEAALRLLEEGGVLALRGIGGFQLLCTATDARVVALLRARKQRPDKPFAVMFQDAAQLATCADVSERERLVLASAEAPIVLVRRRADSPLAENVAPRTPWLGAFLPYTPLHALLLQHSSTPLVCTSGNLAEAPICITTEEAIATLSNVADGILTHDRPIVRPLDDSVVRVAGVRTVVIRRARGYAPRAVGTIDPRVSVLALGGHQKSTVTVGVGGALVPSQHLGDMDSFRARALLEVTARDLCTIFGVGPRVIACDLHPEYASSLLAERLRREWSRPLVRVQHHHAHVAACMAEHAIDAEREVLGLAWDGAGFGDDGTIWGGEALLCRGRSYRRFATLSSFPLLGGDRAARDPRRSALGLLFATLPGEVQRHAELWFRADLGAVLHVLERRLAPTCSSVGRLFDAVAALLGFAQRQTFEAQAAAELEHLASAVSRDGAYSLPLVERGAELVVGDARPLVHAIVEDMRAKVERPRIARRFHEALVDFGVAIAERAGVADVVLAGGAFQNRLLVEGLEVGLVRAGFTVHVPVSVPANDGGLSVGQAWIAALHAADEARGAEGMQLAASAGVRRSS